MGSVDETLVTRDDFDDVVVSARESTVGRMRILAGLVPVVFLLALLPPAAVLADNEIVLDDESPAVQTTGVWATTAATSGFVGSGYHFRVAGDGSSTVVWPFNGPSGSYEVFARWTSGPNRASNATYVVSGASGPVSVKVDQRSGGGAWSSLGTFTFAAGPVKVSPCPTMPTESSSPTPSAGCRRVSPACVHHGPGAHGATPSTSGDPRFFDETQFRVDRDSFWDFFQKRGGLRTFGFPVSRNFTFLGCQTQFFQRVAMQQCGDAGVGTLNVLDAGLLPYDHFHGSTLPAPDPTLIAARRCPASPTTARNAIDFVRANAPDSFDGEPVELPRPRSTTPSACPTRSRRATATPACCRCSTCSCGACRPARPPTTRTITTSSTSASSAASCTTTRAASAPRRCCWRTT